MGSSLGTRLERSVLAVAGGLPRDKESPLRPAGDTHYLPSRVHPALAMYSTLGKSALKGCTSSFSCVTTI